MKNKGTPICISLDQAIVSCRICGPQRMFVNCLPSIDLEFRFLGTIFCEMDDLDQTPPKQTRIHSPALEKRTVLAYFYTSKSTFGCLNLLKLSFFHKDLFVSNSQHKVVCTFSIPRQRYLHPQYFRLSPLSMLYPYDIKCQMLCYLTKKCSNKSNYLHASMPACQQTTRAQSAKKKRL